MMSKYYVTFSKPICNDHILFVEKVQKGLVDSADGKINSKEEHSKSSTIG